MKHTSFLSLVEFQYQTSSNKNWKMKCNWRGGVECTVSRVVSTELACLAWLEETEVCLCNSSEQVLQSLFRSALTPHSPHTIHEIFDVTELSLFTKIYNNT